MGWFSRRATTAIASDEDLGPFRKECSTYAPTCDFRATVDGFGVWADQSGFDKSYSVHAFGQLKGMRIMASTERIKDPAEARRIGIGMVETLKAHGVKGRE